VGGIRTRALLAAGLTAGAVAGALPAPAAAASCDATGSKTARSTPFARVYYDSRGRPFSCYRLTGRRVALDAGVDQFYAPGDAHLGLVRISKRMLGYTWVDPGLPAVYVISVDMRTGRFKRRTKLEPLVVIDPTAVAVPALVVNDVGSLAWIQKLEGYSSVWRFDRRGRRHLDGRDTTQRVTSLRRRDTRLTWRKAGVLLRSTLL
jgi:hypothetical protein